MAISRSARITVLLFIDVVFFLVELIVGYAVGSLALVADSFHMLNDILSLVVALYAIKLTAQTHIEYNTRYSYGWHRAEILAALVNGVFLLALCFSIFMEAMGRFFSTPEISNPRLIVIVGSLGLASNFVGLFLFHEHSHSHGHDHGDQAKQPELTREDASSAVSSGSVTPTAEEQRGRSRDRERADSLFGHPVATRAAVMQAAHELQMARSPSVGRAAFPTSPSTSRKIERNSFFSSDASTAVGEDNDIAEEPSEETPLLNGQKHPDEVATHVHLATDGHDHSEPGTPADEQQPKRKGNGANHGHAGAMNMRALVLHVLGDALGNVGVIATGLVIWLSSWSWKYYFDPMISLVITVIIFSSALPLVKSASFILLQGVPSGISLEEVDEAIRAVPGVRGVHELHIWQLSESKVVASVHVLASRRYDFMKVAAEIRAALHDHGIHSTTIQPEYHSSKSHPATVQCLLPCPPGQTDCNPAEHACCPPPPPPTV